jgi:hypothetical protein
MHQRASRFSLCYLFVLLFLDRVGDLLASRSLAAGFYCVGGTLDVRPVVEGWRRSRPKHCPVEPVL